MTRPLSTTRERREERFWNEHVGTLERCLEEYEAGPDPNTLALLDALEPLDGRTVLDLGCGTGVLSGWLARRGARVTGIDVSPASVERAAEVGETLGFEIELVCDAFPSAALEHRIFDRAAGRYVLHHLGLDESAPALARSLGPGAVAAFVETMATNPVLRLARRHLVGRLGIPRYGTEDERPLGRRELDALAGAIGPLRVVVAQLDFLRILDRQLLGYRSRTLSRFLGKVDDGLLALGMVGASYHQVLVLKKQVEAG